MSRFLVSIVCILLSFGVVFGQSDQDSLMNALMDQVVVTAQFAPTETRETVNSVRVLQRKTIEQRGVLNLQELLQAEPNLRISQDPILGSELSINGLKGENLKILIDGVPVVGRLNGNVDAGQIPLGAIQRVEIIEGAQSLLYGSEASGGVVNLITRKSQTRSVQTEWQGQYETNGFRQLSALAGYSGGGWTAQISGNLQHFIPAPDSSMGRDQTWNPKRQESARAMVRYQPDNRSDVRLTANLLSEEVDNLGDVRRPVFRPYAFDDFYKTRRQDVQLFFDRWLMNGALLQSALGWNHFGRIKNSYRYDLEPGTRTLLEGMQDTSKAEGIMSRFTLASDTPGQRFGYVVGVENYFESAVGTRLRDTLSTDPTRAFTNDFALFASGKYRWKSWVMQSGARYSHNLRYGSALVPSAWVKWQPVSRVQWRFSVASGFRSPSVKELFFSFIDVNHYVIGNTALRPEQSVNVRSELTWEIPTTSGSAMTLVAGGFYNKVSDRIVLTALGPVHYEYRNVDEWRTVGTSLRAQFSMGEWLRFQTDVVYTGFHNAMPELLSDPFLWSPDWTSEMNVGWSEGTWNWNIWHKRTGRTPFFYNQDGETRQGVNDAWHMLNTNITWRIKRYNSRVQVGVKNIFDIRRLQANNANGIHIEASNQQNLHWGRTFFASVTWSL